MLSGSSDYQYSVAFPTTKIILAYHYEKFHEKISAQWKISLPYLMKA